MDAEPMSDKRLRELQEYYSMEFTWQEGGSDVLDLLTEVHRLRAVVAAQQTRIAELEARLGSLTNPPA